MASGDKARLLLAERSGNDAELRAEALRQLEVMKAGDDVAELHLR